MNPTSLFLVVMAFPSVASPSNIGLPAKTDQDLIQGDWYASTLELQVKKSGALVATAFSFKRDEIQLHMEERLTDPGRFRLDPTKTPKIIEVRSGSKRIAGIYALNNNHLKICFNEKAGGDPPSDFRAKPESGWVLYVLERVQAGSDVSQVQGKWYLTLMQVNGETSDTTNRTAVFTGNTFRIFVGDVRSEPAPFRLQPSKTPKGIRLRLDSEMRDGIYDLDNNKLRICFSGKADAPSPDKFESKPGTGHVLYVFQRAKPER
jgi:uncharacterized protein (TIGR03067 family)